MNTTETPRRQVLIPVLVLGLAALAVVLYLVFGGGSDEPAPASKPTATPSAPKPVTATLKGSGSAPKAFAISKASVARGSGAIGIGVAVPDLDLDDLSKITVDARQGGATWELSTVKDPRGAFVSPRLERVTSDGFTEQRQEYACAKGTIRAASARLSVTLPLSCLAKSAGPVRISITLEGKGGGPERTGRTKPLAAPKS